METLIEGYKQFRDAYFTRHRTLFRRLARGQSPEVMVISCCDSRVDPTLIFNARPGDIFTLRNIANLVPPYGPDGAHHSTSAAIEFAVRSLEVGHVIVMGHSSCGGVRALLESKGGEFLGPWMKIAAAAREHVLNGKAPLDMEQARQQCELENIKISLANLRGYPWLAERITNGGLCLHGWYFDIEHGQLYILDEETTAFVAV